MGKSLVSCFLTYRVYLWQIYAIQTNNLLILTCSIMLSGVTTKKAERIRILSYKKLRTWFRSKMHNSDYPEQSTKICRQINQMVGD